MREEDTGMVSEVAGYWLGQCQGFQVYSPQGRVGLVEEVVRGADPALPEALVVRAGLLGQRLELVPIEVVEAIEPRRLRVCLDGSWRPSGRDFLSDLLGRLRGAAAGADPPVDASHRAA